MYKQRQLLIAELITRLSIKRRISAIIVLAQPERISVMETITQILKNFNTLSTYLFIFITNIEPFTLLKEIPKEVNDLINDAELIHLLDEAMKVVSKLNEYLTPRVKKLNRFIRKARKSGIKNDIPYADFKIDEKPIIKTKEDEQLKLDFNQLIAENDISPVKRRKKIEYKGCCPYCNAPSEYLYDNNGKGRQFFCKVCKNTFSLKISLRDTSGFYCPHCGNKLTAHHDRRGYIVYYCSNTRCSYYQDSKKDSLINPDKYKTSSKQFRYRYHYRQFRFNLDEIKDECKALECRVDLSRIHVDEQTLGLILSYYINYGMSSRKVVNILRDLHGIRISHQSVMNYASSVSKIVKNLVDHYPYKLNSTLSADETYVHVSGKQNYVFFFSDPISKIITSYDIFSNRDTRCCVKAMWQSLSKYEKIPEDLSLIADGNPIYNAAQLFYELNGIKFDLHQVIGVKNNDEESKTYRPYKQIEERLNRTYKQNYYGTNGYGSLECANSYMVLYVAFFNFLRRHSSLGFKTPVEDDLFDDEDLMPDKWLKLIKLAHQYNKAYLPA